MASSKPKGLGSSLTIQELAKEPMLVIPERYVRLDNKPCSILSEDGTSQTIPTVDMQLLLMGEATDFQLDKLHSICKEWGIFQKKSLLVKREYKTVFGLMAKALKIDKGEMEEMFDDGMQSVRMSYYPPCPQPEKVMGLRPHSDATGITILLQVNGVEGFQIKKDGIWIPVSFLPDAFVVNVGDTLEILSNGLYNSIEHRVTVNSVKERMSIAMFFNPKFEAEIGPAASFLNPQNPPLFKRISTEKYYKKYFSRRLNGKLFLEQMKTENGEDDTA
ncbi:codeine O-demethylase-like [Camellia sinensis]|uniref:codeine O-demethylase-like n=1 Tax=Camellia sinensis TaxID=4442 RepID=UPI0010367AA1|nr:codeine O-demethylase-like [Camellia sinensis]